MLKPIEHPLNIDLANRINMNKSINIKKNDTESHKFVINIFDNSSNYDLTGSTAKIYFKKADGNPVFASCIIDNAAEGKLSYLLKTQETSFAGLVVTEITVYGTLGEILTSATFNFTVSENTRDDLAIESTSEFTALTDALAVVTGIENKLEKTEFNTFKDSTDASLANIPQQTIGVFLKMLATGSQIVDCYGDSITVGEGSTVGNSWFELFKTRVLAQYPTTVVNNRGIGGKSALYFDGNKGTTIFTGDIAFVMLGTNDRWDNTLSGFYASLKSLITYVKTKYKVVILMSATPAMTDTAVSMNFDTYAMDEVISRVSQEEDLYHISNLRDTNSWAIKHGISYTEMLQTAIQGSHPVNLGHKFLYENICEKLKISINTNYRTGRIEMNIISSTTLVDDVPYGTTSCILDDTNIVGLPTAYGGELISHIYTNGGTQIRNSYQEFIPRLSNMKFMRIVAGDRTWTPWKPLGTFNLTGDFSNMTTLAIGVYYSVILDAGATDMPTLKGGILTVIKLDANLIFAREEFSPWDSNTKWIRKHTGTVWGYWEKLSINRTSSVSADFTTIPANTMMSKEVVTTNIIDTAYYATLVCPTSVIDTNLMFSYTFISGGKRLFIRLYNIGATPVVANVLTFDVVEVKK